MSNDYMATKYRGQARLAAALKALGWQVFGETEGDPNAAEMINLALWHGYATHPDFPGIVVVCGIDDRNETEYRQPDWPAFRHNDRGIFYHMEDDGHYLTSGNGAYWAGDLAQGMEHAQNHANFIHRRATNVTKAKQRKAEKEQKRLAKEQRDKERAEKLAAKEKAKADKVGCQDHDIRPQGGGGPDTLVKPAKKSKAKKEAAADATDAAESAEHRATDAAADAGAAAETKPAKAAKTPKSVKVENPADLIVLDLKPLSPLILNPVPVVVDALVTALLEEPEWLPPGTDFAGIAADKIATFYGFDKIKTTNAARQLATLLRDPDISARRAQAARHGAAQPGPHPIELAEVRGAARRKDLQDRRPAQLCPTATHRLRRPHSLRRAGGPRRIP